MKLFLHTTLAVTILGLFTFPLKAHAQTSNTSYIQTSQIIGTKVKGSQGEEVGEIKDVVLDRNTGCMAYTVLSAGGTGTRITGAAKTVAVPWTVYSFTSDPHTYTVRVDAQKIYNAPVFDYARIDEYSRTGWINNVYSYYGVSANVGTGSQSSVTSGASTTVGSAGATASPYASATASPTASESATATPSPTTTASPKATRSPRATPTTGGSAGTSPHAMASPRATRGESQSGKTKPTMTPGTSRHHTETAPGESREEAAPEGAGSPSGASKKSSHHRTPGGTTEPNATPRPTEGQE